MNYTLLFYTYRGATTLKDKKCLKKVGSAQLVVKKLIEVGNYFNKGYDVFVDNVYSSVG